MEELEMKLKKLEGFYKASVNCTNCGYYSEAFLRKGEKIEEVSCLKCGCKTLSKAPKFTLWN